LKTPFGLQPCSSSPISGRFGSLDSVVLPVPDRPKNSAASPGRPSAVRLTLAEQCIGSTPSAGSFQFITPKMLFLISPPYSLPAITIMRSVNDAAMAVLLRTPSVAGSAWKLGACRMT